MLEGSFEGELRTESRIAEHLLFQSFLYWMVLSKLPVGYIKDYEDDSFNSFYAGRFSRRTDFEESLVSQAKTWIPLMLDGYSKYISPGVLG